MLSLQGVGTCKCVCAYVCLCAKFVWHSLCSCANYITEQVKVIREVERGEATIPKSNIINSTLLGCSKSIYTHPSPYFILHDSLWIISLPITLYSSYFSSY